MKCTVLPSSLCAVFGLVGLARAYLVDPPTTAASDTIQDCSNWAVVTSTDKCQSIADSWGITLAQFQSYVSTTHARIAFSSGNTFAESFGRLVL